MRESRWPNGAYCAVNITVDFDGESIDIVNAPDKTMGGRYSYGRYAVKIGLTRTLNLLREQNVRATFFVPGWDAEQHPEKIREIIADGHEIAAHGYLHEDFSKLGDGERSILEKTHAALTNITGVSPKGWRAPRGLMSSRTHRLLKELGYLYDSSFNNDDLPYLIEIDGAKSGMVELPQFGFLDDGPLYEVYKTPRTVEKLWKEEFDAIYEEGLFFSLKLHPRGDAGSGRAVRIRAIDELLSYIKRHPGIWFATSAEVAEWWLERGKI